MLAAYPSSGYRDQTRGKVFKFCRRLWNVSRSCEDQNEHSVSSGERRVFHDGVVHIRREVLNGVKAVAVQIQDSN